MSKPRVVAITGATATGKSALALALAQRLGAEIICMDSMQIYRRMDIGTAKPSQQEQALIPHHMLDIVEPDAPYAVADYVPAAEEAIAQVLKRGRIPLLVGGTGLYLKALMHGLTLGNAGSDDAFRDKLKAIAAQSGGKEQLHRELAQVDAATAAKLHPNDQRRVIRALEVYHLTGIPMSAQPQQMSETAFDILPLVVDVPRDLLRQRIERRVHAMMAQELLEEVRSLLKSGVSPQAQSMQGIGYKELIPVVLDGADPNEAVLQIILNTRHYAKRQCTWFKGEPSAVWLDGKDAQTLMDATLRRIEAFLHTTKGENDA